MIYFIGFLLTLYFTYTMKFKDNYKNSTIIIYILLDIIILFLISDNRAILLTPITIYIAIKDLKEYIIPHYCNFLLLLINLYFIIINYDANRLKPLITILITFGLLYLLYLFNKIGGGDILLIPNLICFMTLNEIIGYIYVSCILAVILYLFIKFTINKDINKNIPFGPPLILAFLFKYL